MAGFNDSKKTAMKSLFTSTRLLLILFVPLSLLTTSCSFIASEVMGVRHIKPVKPATHKRLLKKLGGDPMQSFIVDTNYVVRLNLNDTTKRFQIKNHYQAIQALYFGKNQYPESWFINCYAPGFPNLQWNKNNNFAVFPPTTAAPLDSLVNFNEILETAVPFVPNNPKPTITSESPYTIVFFWNRFMFKQCKRLYKEVRKNATMTNEKVRIIYINNDEIMVQSQD
jgi:hypothetical protein